MDTKHALKTKVGLKEKKIQELEARLEVEPKSPTGESLKESIRLLVSFLVGIAVAWVYQRYPFLGELQPDQAAFVVVITSVIVRSLDKFWYQLQKNNGNPSQGVGIDRVFTTMGKLMLRSKTPVIQSKQDKK